MKTDHELQPYWDLILADINANVLNIALQGAWFDFLTLPQSADTVAEHFKLHQKNTCYYLEILWGMGLLDRCSDEEITYQNTSLSKRYFCSQSKNYLGDAFLFRLKKSHNISQELSAYIESDFQPITISQNKFEKSWAQAASQQIMQEQRAITKQVAQTIIKKLSAFMPSRRLLDLGGGPGLVAIELLKANPLLTGTIFDFPDTVKVAQHNIQQAGLSYRLNVIGGNIIHDSIGGGYDLIWCSSVLHFIDDIQPLLDKIYRALNPGGVLISAHAEIPLKREHAQRILPYYLSMQIQGRPLLATRQLAESLKNTGFIQIEQQDNIAFAVVPVSLIIARKTK